MFRVFEFVMHSIHLTKSLPDSVHNPAYSKKEAHERYVGQGAIKWNGAIDRSCCFVGGSGLASDDDDDFSVYHITLHCPIPHWQ